MAESEQSRKEILDRLKERFGKLLEEKFPQEPGTLEEIERIAEDVGSEIKRDAEREYVEWHGTGYVGPTCVCGCREQAKFKGYYGKLAVTLSGELNIDRAYYYCSSCGEGHAPLDAKLGLDRGWTSVGVRTKVGRLSAWLPFEEVSLELGELCGINISANTARRIAESMGKRIKDERREREREVLSGGARSPEISPERLYIAIDGAHVPMRDGSYHEAKCGVVYQTVQNGDKIKISDAKYTATLERTAAFGEQVYAVAFDQGVENAKELGCLGDGATWIWNSFSLHYPDAVHILDFFHAAEHLGDVAKAWYGEGSDMAKHWLEARKLDLLSDCVEDVIESIRIWHPEDDKAKEIRRLELGYLENNKHRMLYATFQANGYHIGSGLAESACKMVVTQRLKQSGMRWTEPGAEKHSTSPVVSFE